MVGALCYPKCNSGYSVRSAALCVYGGMESPAERLVPGRQVRACIGRACVPIIPRPFLPLNSARLDWPHLPAALPQRLHHIPGHLHPVQRLRMHQAGRQPLLLKKVLLLFLEPLLHLVSSVFILISVCCMVVLDLSYSVQLADGGPLSDSLLLQLNFLPQWLA